MSLYWRHVVGGLVRRPPVRRPQVPTVGGLSRPPASISRRSVGPSRVAEWSHPCLLRSTSTARPRDCDAAVPPRRACRAFQRRSPWLDEASAKRALAAPPRETSDASATPQRRPHPGARPRRPGGRGGGPARARRRRRCARSSRPSRCWCARSMPGSGRTRPSSDAHRAEQLKRLDGIATILAKTAVRDSSLLALLAEDAVVSDAARSLKRDMLRAVGIESTRRRGHPDGARGRGRDHRAAGRAAVGRLTAARQPLPRPRLRVRAGRARPARAASPAGSCSARSAGRSSAPAAEPRPAWPFPRRPPGTPRVAWS